MDEATTYLLTWRQRTRTGYSRSGWQQRQADVRLSPAMAAAADPEELARQVAKDAEIVTNAKLYLPCR
jgi:hypothetical protein